MWLIVQQDTPDDYVIATGEHHSVREFIERAFSIVGRDIGWRGKGTDEVGFDEKTGEILIQVDPQYFRPTEVDLLVGDPTKAHKTLGWRHRISFDELIKEMVAADMALISQHNQGQR
jgi:GDPmannose 4,6-dehydratase